MAKTNPRHDYKKARERLKDDYEDGKIAESDYQAITEYLDAIDEQKPSVTPGVGKDGEKISTKEPGTIKTHCRRLDRFALWADKPLTEMTADDVNELTQSLLDGSHPDAKDGGYSQNYVSNNQATLRAFYNWAEFGPEKDDISLLTAEKSEVDPRDIYTREEIHAMREACNNPRERAEFEMLINTGQRITALRTLRKKDIDLEEGVFYLNTNADGLKEAEKNGRKRFLFGAEKAVRDWLQYHPSDNPDAALFCSLGNPGSAEEPISYSQFWRDLKGIAERAGIDDKPVNPHQFRHAWVTIAKRDYGLDDDEIKYQLGHAKASKVMQQTYQHISADSYVDSMKEKTGYKEPEDDSPLTPDVCDTCGENLPPNAKACPSCGQVYTPDAKAVQKQVQQDVGGAKALAQLDEADLSEEQIEAVANDDAIMAKLIEMRSQGD